MDDQSELGAVAVAQPVGHGLLGGVRGLFRPSAPAAVMLTDPAEIAENYRSWQKRVLVATIIGYASTVLSGWGLGTLVQHFGWDAAFRVLVAATVIGTLLFIAAWPAKAHGYTE